MYLSTLISTFALLRLSRAVPATQCTIAAPACSSPGPETTYTPEPCFPNSGVCYPTNYYAALDQGQLFASFGSFDTQVQVRCAALCDLAGSQCASFVGVINKAADSQLATATCFLYNSKQVYPRQCADSPSEIIAYYKQGICRASTTSSTTTTTKPSTTTTKSSSTTTTKSTTKSSTTTTSSTKSSTTLSTTTRSSTTTLSATTKSTTTTSSTTTKSTTTSSSSTTKASTTTPSTTAKSTTTSSSTTTEAGTTTASTTLSTTSSSTTASTTASTTSSSTTASTTSSSTTTASTTSSSTTASTTTASTTSSTTTRSTTTTSAGCSASYSSATITNTCGTAFPSTAPPNYTAVFSGQGVTEDPNNPGNDGPTITTTFTDLTAQQNCDAITRCANTCSPAYWSFDLHYYCTTATWECICYYDFQPEATYFDVSNSQISQVYGYNAVF